MPPMQRTFQLIPEGAKPVSRPPMTSKAAKKAYLKANQGGGQKVSRAEQRRLDREAVERLNREYEREKAAAKAKAAREKKAAKANAEREERRRKGIPEPSRHVRASQPTISRFVWPGNKRTLQEMEEMEEEDTQAKDTMADREVAFEPIVEEAEELDNAVVTKIVEKTNMEPPAKKIAIDMSSDDEFGDFPSLSQSDIFQRMDSSMPSFQDRIVSNLAQKEASDPESDDFPTLSQCDLLEKGSLPLGAITISRSCTPNPQRLSTTSPKRSAHATVNMPPPKCMPSRYPLHGRSANTISPPALPRSNKATSFPPAVSRFSAQQTQARGYKIPMQNAAPTPTQAFLESNLDDFFPSRSQEIRELLDDVDDIPSNTQIAMELGTVKQKSKDSNDPLGDLFPTPDFALSSQDMLDMDTPSRPPNQPPGKNNRIVHQPLPRSSLGKETSINSPNISHVPDGRNESASVVLNNFLTTAPKSQIPLQQPHLVKTTRPLPTTTLTKSQARNDSAPPHYLPPGQITNQNNTHSGSHCNPVSQHNLSSPKPPPIPPKTPLSPPPKRRFFQEKPEDQLHAVLWESKIEAQAAEKTRQQAQALEKAQKQGEAQAKAKEQAQAKARERQQAQQKAESEAQAKVPVKESPSRNKRTLQRAQSSATDYGDDEFSGCSQELLALC